MVCEVGSVTARLGRVVTRCASARPTSVGLRLWRHPDAQSGRELAGGSITPLVPSVPPRVLAGAIHRDQASTVFADEDMHAVWAFVPVAKGRPQVDGLGHAHATAPATSASRTSRWTPRSAANCCRMVI